MVSKFYTIDGLAVKTNQNDNKLHKQMSLFVKAVYPRGLTLILNHVKRWEDSGIRNLNFH